MLVLGLLEISFGGVFFLFLAPAGGSSPAWLQATFYQKVHQIQTVIFVALKKQEETESYAPAYNEDQDNIDSTEATVEDDLSEEVFVSVS